jgi:DNA-binding transcriptional LysR family regulator
MSIIDALYDSGMDVRLLEYFVTVADERSLTRAAARLFVAQSTVSAGLQSLERDLGVRLLERSTKAVSLSSAGDALLPIARDVLDGVETLRSTARESAGGLRGRVRLGTFAAMQILDLPGILRLFRRTHAGVDVRLVTSATGSTGMLEDVEAGRLDLAFVALPAGGAGATPVLRRPFVALVPDTHRLASRTEVSLHDLADEEWIDVLPGFGNRVQLDARLSDLGISRRLSAEVADLPSVGAFVAAGLGVAVVPDVVASDGCRSIALRDDLPEWVVSLVVRRGGEKNRAVAALAETIRSSASGEVAD